MNASPLTHPVFRRLFAAQVIALVGTGLSTIALTLLAYDLVGGNAAVVLGTALAFKMIAYVVFAPIAGGLAHRFPRKPFLIAMDVVRAAIVLLFPLATQVWQIYLLIFLLNLFSAGFKPVFSATIPDILPDERQYTRALSMSRLAYDLENMLSPLLAGLALLFVSHSALFTTNAIAFIFSAGLIAITRLPASPPTHRLGGLTRQISFGVLAYLKTPRLRGLLALYLSVASASAMVIVNTVVYVRQTLGGSESDVAMAMAVAGGGSMIVALALPRILDKWPDRPIMLAGTFFMAAGLTWLGTSPRFVFLLPALFLVGAGLSVVQTPAGRLVNRSSAPGDRAAYFSAQFALSHACWLIFYPIAGYLGTWLGIEMAALVLAAGIMVFAILATVLWPTQDDAPLVHVHEEVDHEHEHLHDEHHDHEHEHDEGDADQPHSHSHRHAPIEHTHSFVIDDHHRAWPKYTAPT
ncbi:MAG: MFS transporter [Gemmatimonadetes bacterium]|jgi:MFS family permease|nr:MFS transporter [Gemmatimonadota bacterium]MBT7862764.1 MFS transporter [Gemmatimonadota bacterium]